MFREPRRSTPARGPLGNSPACLLKDKGRASGIEWGVEHRATTDRVADTKLQIAPARSRAAKFGGRGKHHSRTVMLLYR